MKRWSVTVVLKGEGAVWFPGGVGVWFDPSLSHEEHRNEVREGLTVLDKVLKSGGVFYLPTSDRSTMWVHTDNVAGIEIVGPEGDEPL